MKSIVTASLVLLIAVAANAQTVLEPHTNRPKFESTEQAGPYVIHVTDMLSRRPEAVAALEDFRRRKSEGLTMLGKVSTDTVGDTLTFRVYNFATSTTETEDFILKAANSIAQIWVAVGESTGPGGNGHVTDQHVADLSTALESSTPAGSYNPSAGILANNIAVFGNPPNVDGDNKSDILLYDIIDGGVPGGGFIAGYFNPADLSPLGGGNNRDILYMDSNQGLLLRTFDAFLGTAAHELQHVIHANYSTTEETFVNEGLSEWAEIMNGYPGRFMRYLADAAERGLSLFSWDGRNLDYERAGLVTTYLAQRTDPLTAGSITREPRNGRSGYNQVLATRGLTFEELIVDFHTATLLNGSGLTTDPDYGFAATTFAGTKVTLEPTVTIDGRTASETVRRDTVKGGAVLYRVWTDVEDFELTAAPWVEGGQTRDLTLGRASLRAVIEYPDGTTDIQDLELEPNGRLFSGMIDRFTLIFVHKKPVSSAAIGGVASDRLIYDYSASWRGSGETTVTTQYDNGQPDLFLSIPASQHFATRFPIADSARTTLDVASIAIYYSNQFSGGPSDLLPRDFTLNVWSDSAGAPHELLFSKEIIDPRPNEDVFQGQPLRFLDIDLSNEAIPALPSAVHIGASNAGSDGNTIVTGIAVFDVENVSFLSGDRGNTWAAMWDVSLQSGESLNEKMSAVRLQVLVADVVSVEDELELPTRLTLEQNFPNPFNPTTTIQYSLPAAADVSLRVYDILGREIARLVHETQPAGVYRVSVDAGRWASGMYVYSLQAGDQRLMRNMVLLK